MTPVWKYARFVVVALVGVALSTAAARAQWTVSYYQPYTTYYAPAATAYQTYYAPAATYQTYYTPYTSYYGAAPVVQTSGWYPGYWWDRVRTTLFGPRTVVVNPTTYTASYPTTYAASYPASYATSYAPAACSTCAPVQQVTMRPVCAPACASCDACTGCSVSNISQTSYVESASTCTNCTTPAASDTSVYGPTPAGPSELNRTFQNENSRPGLPPNSTTPEQRTQYPPAAENPQTGGNSDSNSGSNSQPPAGGDASTSPQDPLQKFLDEKETRSFFQPPELFDPKDKTVKHSPAPVQMAVYKRAAGTTAERLPTRPISLEKAKRDAVGWSSARN